MSPASARNQRPLLSPVSVSRRPPDVRWDGLAGVRASGRDMGSSRGDAVAERNRNVPSGQNNVGVAPCVKEGTVDTRKTLA